MPGICHSHIGRGGELLCKGGDGLCHLQNVVVVMGADVKNFCILWQLGTKRVDDFGLEIGVVGFIAEYEQFFLGQVWGEDMLPGLLRGLSGRGAVDDPDDDLSPLYGLLRSLNTERFDGVGGVVQACGR